MNIEGIEEFVMKEEKRKDPGIRLSDVKLWLELWRVQVQ
jgi:hypothetical protein